MSPAKNKQRLVKVELDEESIGRSNPDVEHEREVAIYDLLEQNSFAPIDDSSGPYVLHLKVDGARLERNIFAICIGSAIFVYGALFLRGSGGKRNWRTIAGAASR